MKRWIIFAFIIAAGGAALAVSEVRKAEAPVGPQAFLYLVADTEQELTRMPVSFTRLTDEREIEIGDGLAKQYTPFFGLQKMSAETRLVQTYVQKVGGRVAAGAHRKLPYRFHYIPDGDFINAFALPGGHVFIGKGLIAVMVSEDELAFVLGHEIEHIDHYHCAERAQTEEALRKIPLGELWAPLPMVFEAGYTKDQELEADREGTRLAAQAGYSPQGALDMFETYDRLFREHVQHAGTPQEELAYVAVLALKDYFRSHPPAREREARIRDLIASEHWENPQRVRELEVAYIFNAEKAKRALAGGHYPVAQQLATRALQQNPEYPPALEAQAEAQIALQDFPNAKTTYAKLLDLDPASAGQVVNFADKLAAGALNQGNARLAADLSTQVLGLQVNERRALGILISAQIELGKIPSAKETYLRLKSLYPPEAGELLRNLDMAAAAAFKSGKYQECVRLSSGALALQPSRSTALAHLADAQFLQGHFSEAAHAYRALIETRLQDKSPLKPDLLGPYADALGSGEGAHNGWKDFSQLVPLLKSQSPQVTARADVELAGLMLMAGDASMAKELSARAHAQTPRAVAPESLGRLGWWYCRAHNPGDAEAFLRDLVRLRPYHTSLKNYLGWATLDVEPPQAALDIFQPIAGDWTTDLLLANTPQMGRAVALWRLNRQDEALRDFQVGVKSAPQWLAPQWVAAIYSPGVARSVNEMAAAYQKRLRARRQAPAQRVR
jgi:predicted Zn-dependent protease